VQEFSHPPSTDADRIAWRKQRRVELLSLRGSLAEEVHRHNSDRILGHLGQILRGNHPAIVAGYWPFRDEVNLLGLIEELLTEGWVAALPAVVAKAQPLEFRPWRPDDPMTPGVFGIPVPSQTNTVQPDILLVPLVGFDDGCFRLGYGGGYYDRTLAATATKPLAIGVGFEVSHMQSIYPCSFDIPMDCIVTEGGVRRRR
jgi:5-formyltetrahydrofolate cyclo-ligase